MDEVERPIMITGNWKMHKTVEEALDFVEKLDASLNERSYRIRLAVPYTVIYPLNKQLSQTQVAIGAQNMNEASEGAFTGEIAASMLLDAGAKFVLLGHSERRTIYLETNEMIHAKLKKAVQYKLAPVLCVGENLAQYQAGQTQTVIEEQISSALKDLTEQDLSDLVLAYEPVWAIGTGESATPEIVQNVHAFCRQILASLFSDAFAQKIVIQYGGSVNRSNARHLLAQPDIDGLLIGGVSLSLENFLEIVNDNYSKNQQRV